MSGQHAAFVGSIPENYDRYLGPLLFEPYAADIVGRFEVREGGAVLEIACGTGIVTRRLRERLPSSVKLVATDLNDAMLNYAREKTGPAELLEWKQADATELPFDDASFDAVVCQFGLMFFPDKSKALREVARVLVPGGVFAFNVWDKLETNELALIAHQKIGSLFPHDPPGFYKVPFSLHDKAAVEKLLSDAGFSEAQITTLHAECVGHPANETAMGLVQGNPVMVEINQRGTPSVAEVTEAVASELRSRFGEDPIRSKLRAIVFVART